jgi:uncharacterized protein
MQISTLWTGREYYSLENCLVTVSESGAVINSTIIGKYEEKIYQVDYTIKTNQLWQTLLLDLRYRHSDFKEHLLLECDGKGNWQMNGREAGQFNGCTEVDIPLTPFTNTLPIRRLNLSDGQSQEIQVVYCDVLEQQIQPVRQLYSCLSSKLYHYENIPNDFEADIIIDEHGLVVDYPALFIRTAALPTNYLL